MDAHEKMVIIGMLDNIIQFYITYQWHYEISLFWRNTLLKEVFNKKISINDILAENH